MEKFDIEYDEFADAHIIVRKITSGLYTDNEETTIVGYIPFREETCKVGADKELRDVVFDAADKLADALQYGEDGIHIEVRFTMNYINA